MNIEDLKQKALAATPGPWIAEASWQSTFLEGKHDGKWAIRKSNTSFGFAPLAYVKGDKRITGGDGALNAQFIAAANPTTILALIEQHEAAHSELLATRDDNHSMMLEIEDLRKARDELLAALKEAAISLETIHLRSYGKESHLHTTEGMRAYAGSRASVAFCVLAKAEG